MKIVRPWAAEGDYFEVIEYEPDDRAEMFSRLGEHMQSLTPEQRYEASTRYMRRKLGIDDEAVNP